MSRYSLAIWTNSGIILAAADFPLYITSISGSCQRSTALRGIEAETVISDYLILRRRLTSSLRPVNPERSKTIGEILLEQPKGYDVRISKMDVVWMDENDVFHTARFERFERRRGRTIDEEYEREVLNRLYRVRDLCQEHQIPLYYWRPSMLLMTKLDDGGLPTRLEDADILFSLIGTYLASGNPLSRILYDVVEITTTMREVEEIRVVDRVEQEAKNMGPKVSI